MASEESETCGARVPGEAHIVRLWEAIASAANQADTLEEASQACLDAVCSLTGWPVGHLYAVVGGTLKSTKVWHVDDPDGFSRLRRATALTSLAVGEGLPGEVAAKGRPVWISDIKLNPNFQRSARAHDLEVRAAFAVPVLLGSEVVAVLEFFSPAPAPVDQTLLDLVARVGSQLSRVVERQRAAEQVASSDQRLRRILETANESFVSMDAEGIITEWNHCAETTFGWLRNEALGRSLAELLVPPRYREAHLRGVERFRATGEGKVVGTTVELSALHRAGHEIPIELSIWALREGNELTFNGLIRNISARRRSEQERDGLRAALESAVEGIAQVGPDGRFTQVNEGYAVMCGWQPDEMVGLHWMSTVHPDDHDKMLEGYRTMLDVGRAALEATAVRRDGSEFEEQVVLVSSHDGEGRFTGHVGCVQDITARRKAEAELRYLLEREREVVERLTQLDQEKTDFVSCVSHELRTPLTSMLGYLELLSDGAVGALGAEQVQVLDVVDRNAHRLLNLIEDLLTVSQVEAGTFRLALGPVDLDGLVKSAVALLSPRLAERRLELEAEISADVGTIIGDAAHLEKVLVNVLGNAVKFTPEGGRVALRVWRDGDTVTIAVVDNGIGISEEEQPRLFERFFRSSDATKLAIPGTGLGLGLVRDIVDQHHGHIDLRSSPGYGTEITITLPNRPAQAPAGRYAPLAATLIGNLSI